jgi:curved DNA-binding protein CbpA
MKYFNHIETLGDLKSEYRLLAMENHPDRGGSVEAMQKINVEFETLFNVLKAKPQSCSFWSGFEPNETASDFKRQFYTQNGWAGSRYSDSLRLRDIAPIVRGYAKDVHPSWKFSIFQEHYANGCSLYVCLMEAPTPIFTDEGIRNGAREAVWERQYHGTEEEAYTHYKREADSGYLQNWGWHYGWMTDRAREVLRDVEGLVESYRFSDSDAMYDYYSTNFSANYYIGKWDKPLKIAAKQERLQTAKSSAGAKRIAG